MIDLGDSPHDIDSNKLAVLFLVLLAVEDCPANLYVHIIRIANHWSFWIKV